MDEAKWNNTLQTAAVKGKDLLSAVERVSFARSSQASSSLSGVMLVVADGDEVEAVATDGTMIAVGRFALHGPLDGSDQAVYVVPASFAATLGNSFEFDDDQLLLLGYRDDDDGPFLLVRDPAEPERTLIQPLWDSTAHIDIYNETFSGRSAATTVTCKRQDLYAVLSQVLDREQLVLAAVPGRLLIATRDGSAQDPVDATFEGNPVRVEVERNLFEEALRNTDSSDAEAADLRISFYPTDETLGIQTVDGDDPQRRTDVPLTAHMRTGASTFDRSQPYPGSQGRQPGAHVVIAPQPAASTDTVLAEIDALVGLESVKEHAALIVRQAKVNDHLVSQGRKGSVITTHLVFAGAPGTGKSLAAGHLARLYKALGLLSEDTVTEVDRVSLLDYYTSGGQGRTAKQLIDDSMGGILLIDDAFALSKDKDNDQIQSIIAEVLTAVKKQRGQFVCIVTGTPDETQQFLTSDIDLRNSFTKTITFPPYGSEDLVQIAESMVNENDGLLAEDAVQALSVRLKDHERRGGMATRDWANAVSIANLVDAAIGFRNVRNASDEIPQDIDELVTIHAQDIDKAADSMMIGRVAGASESVEDILAELDSLTGQPQLKAKVRTLLATVKAAQAKEEHGISSGPFFVEHMLFVGPPGTGKTTVARLLGRLYRALGILPKGEVVEVDHGDLKGEYEGHTAIKTTAAIDRAMGGVLLIDEAYQIVGANGADKFGQEAIATLLKRMEDDRGKFLVIATGYPNDMKTFLKSNVGLPRRFGVTDAENIFSGPTIEFVPYTATELFEIARGVANGHHNVLKDSAAAMLETRLVEAGKAGLFERATWGNAGAVRGIVEAAIQARDERVVSGDDWTKEDLTTLQSADIEAACKQKGLNAGGQGDESVESVLAELEALTGQPKLKREIKLLLDQVRMNQTLEAQGVSGTTSVVQHLVFTGPPGTGKTTVARLIARLYKAMGLLPLGNLVEVTRNDLVGSHVGETAIKTKAKFDEAMGGVLFIDEAYTLSSGGGNDFGKEAIDTLVPLMENNRGRVMVVAAGYTGDMVSFLTANTGLKSRFERTIEFEPYTAIELSQIAADIASSMQLSFEPAAQQLLDKRLAAAGRGGQFAAKDWGNARVMRQMIERAQKVLSGRVMDEVDHASVDKSVLLTLTESDIATALDEQGIGGGASSDGDLESVLAELDTMVGQPQLKQKVREIVAAAQAARLRAEHGHESTSPTLNHMLFVGPPGTGKTTVARLIAKLYSALGLLPKGHLVEVDRSGLVAGYIGHTAKKTNTVVDQALGGVLFIDEAYALVRGSENDFGGEAIDALLKRLSDDEGQFLAIAAGYPQDMGEFVKYNPGLSRRFSQTIEFVPYTAAELLAIAEVFARHGGEALNDRARTHLAQRLETAESEGVFERSDWGNAGSVINIIKAAVQKRDARIFDSPASKTDLTTLRAHDIQEACDQAGLPRGQVEQEPVPELVSDALSQNELNEPSVLPAPSHGSSPSGTVIADVSSEPTAGDELGDAQKSLDAILAELDRQPIRPQTKKWIRSLAAKTLSAQFDQKGSTLSNYWRFEGAFGPDMQTVARLLADFYRVVGVTRSDQIITVDLADSTDPETLSGAFSQATGGAIILTGVSAVAGGDHARRLSEQIQLHGATALVIVAGDAAVLQRFLGKDRQLKSNFRWSITFDGQRETAPRKSLPSSTSNDIPAEIAAIVGEVAEILAPGATPGVAVPAGPELAALGIEELYWQRARSGGGGGMGIQCRPHAGSKALMYYFSGGSDGRLPAMFESAGESVPKASIRDLKSHVSPLTLAEWQSRPGAAQELARQILDGISIDRDEGPIL